MKRIEHLNVYLGGAPYADIRRSRHGTLRLTYHSDKAAPGITPLSTSLRPEQGSFSGEIVNNYLWGLLPEDAAARAAVHRLYGVDPRDPLALLSAIGKDCAGAVQFTVGDETIDADVHDGDLVPADDVEGRLAAMRMSDDASWTLDGDHWSLNGTQQKFTLRRRGDSWYYPRGAAASSHIVKPGVRDVKHQALLEHLSMDAGRRLGITVAPTTFEDFGSERAIVVERFDRAATEDGRLTRLHQEDMCQALGVEQKYEEFGGPSAADVAHLLRRAASTAREGEQNVRAFIDALVYNTLIGAPDAHARNYAALLDGDSLTFAPLYDVATGLAYEPGPSGKRIASMSVGGVFDLDRIDNHAWQRFASDLDVDASAVLARRDELAGSVAGAFEASAAAVDDWDGSVDAVMDRLRPRLRALGHSS